MAKKPETDLEIRLAEVYPDRTYESEEYTMKHEDYGKIKLEVQMDKNSLIMRLMGDILRSKTHKLSMFDGAIVAELTPESQLRIRAIKRLRKNAK